MLHADRQVPHPASPVELQRPEEPELTRTIATVMFTDIENSTSLARTLDVTDMAAFLRQHFSLARSVVEDSWGTVVGPTGDGICAFWPSAVSGDPVAPQLALSAAAELARRITEENYRRQAARLLTRRVRIGLHCGEVLLEQPSENSGFVQLYGATAHEARRVEQAGKQVGARDKEVVVMASCATLHSAGIDPETICDKARSRFRHCTVTAGPRMTVRENRQSLCVDCHPVFVDFSAVVEMPRRPGSDREQTKRQRSFCPRSA